MNVGHFLRNAAERQPDRPGLVFGEHVVSYGLWNQRATRFAAALRQLGVQRGDRVGVLLWNCPELLETFFGVWKAGACIVPLNARFLREEVVYHLNDSESVTVVFGAEFREMIAEAREHLGTVRHFICVGEPLDAQLDYEAVIRSGEPSAGAEVDVADNELAWLFYTSGTTGHPKGAMLTHGNLTFMSVGWLADLMQLESRDVGLHAAPLTHGAGFHSLALVLAAAPQLILKPARFDPESFCRTVATHGVTNTWLVPTQIKLLLQYGRLADWDLGSLKWIVYGGAPMYVSDLVAALKVIGPVFVQLYGQGETPMTATVLRKQDHVLESPASHRLASCGIARSGVEISILDERGAELPRGEVGEICVRGPSVMKGYWRRPEASAEALRLGWLHTGDLGAMDASGFVYIRDRSKDMIITGGSNVYPREVEEVLLRHPSVAEACVLGIPDDLWGEAVQAIVVMKPRCQVTETELIDFVGARLASYKKPRGIRLVTELPKNAYGKVSKRDLFQLHWKQRN